MSEILEIIMIVSFGASWPLNVEGEEPSVFASDIFRLYCRYCIQVYERGVYGGFFRKVVRAVFLFSEHYNGRS